VTVTNALSIADVRLLRLRAQRLGPDTGADTVPEVVRSTCGIQAQDRGAGTLSIRPRNRDLTAADVERALTEERSIVRTWCMRGTLHFVASEDLSWLLSLFGPHYTARGPERRALAEGGIDDEAADRAMAVIHDALAADGPLTREEIAAHLRDGGVDVDPEGQAPYYLVRRAALCGVLCEVTPKDGTIAYDLLDEWLPSSAAFDRTPDRDDALATLARRYLRAFGPATVEDFATWCRLYKRDVRKAWHLIGDERVAVRTDGDDTDDERMAMLADRVSEIEVVTADESGADRDHDDDHDRVVRLLPYYDTSLLGYETDSRGVPAEYTKRVWPGSALIRPTVTIDGRTVGIWTLDRSRKIATVEIEPFDTLDETTELGIDAEIRDIGRFLDCEIERRSTA